MCPLIVAIQNGNEGILHLLLNHPKIDVNIKTVFILNILNIIPILSNKLCLEYINI